MSVCRPLKTANLLAFETISPCVSRLLAFLAKRPLIADRWIDAGLVHNLVFSLHRATDVQFKELLVSFKNIGTDQQTLVTCHTIFWGILISVSLSPSLPLSPLSLNKRR